MIVDRGSYTRALHCKCIIESYSVIYSFVYEITFSSKLFLLHKSKLVGETDCPLLMMSLTIGDLQAVSG